MRILISNDDGPNSEGLDILIDFAKEISDDVWVVVPESQRSAGGHGITIHNILKIREISDKFFTTTGTPADCVLLGIYEIMKGKMPDLVLSGVNAGWNIGDDISYSGTIAVAREAAMHQVRSIAFSQVFNNNLEYNFESARKNIRKVYDLIKDYKSNDAFLNINFPVSSDVKDIKMTYQGSKKRIDSITRSANHRNEEYFWLDFALSEEEIKLCNKNFSMCDIDAIRSNYISITPLLTRTTCFDELRKLIDVYE